jgi:tRNA wybutosine-synthesizing protein 3
VVHRDVPQIDALVMVVEAVKKEKGPRSRRKAELHGPPLCINYSQNGSHPSSKNMAQPLPPSFVAKKQRILEQLGVPVEQYDDLSPKGSIDEGIRDLIDEINAFDGWVTTSSCAGRISVFLEGKKKPSSGEVSNGIEDGERIDATSKGAGVGGKGGGGKWLFVSHDPVEMSKHAGAWKGFFGMQSEDAEGKELLSSGAARDVRFIHFKFEPMVKFNVFD